MRHAAGWVFAGFAGLLVLVALVGVVSNEVSKSSAEEAVSQSYDNCNLISRPNARGLRTNWKATDEFFTKFGPFVRELAAASQNDAERDNRLAIARDAEQAARNIKLPRIPNCELLFDSNQVGR